MELSPSKSSVAKVLPQGKLILITGVTKGLGRALALELASRGHVIIGCGRDEEKLASLEAQLVDTKHFLKVVDLASDSKVQDFAKLVIGTMGVPDIIGVINKLAKIWEIPAKEFDEVIDINVKGVANCLRHFLQHMVVRRKGIIVNFSSGWGRSGAAEVSPYCASKWAIEGLTRAVAKEVPSGLGVIALSPGVVHTDLLETCFGAAASNYQTPETWAPNAANMILSLTAADNGTSLTVV